MVEIERIKAEMEKGLPPKRYAHTLAVADTAVWIADHTGVDPDRAYAAAILHDAGKRLKGSELLQYCEKENLFASEDDRLVHGVHHALAGAHMAEKEFNVTDPELISAVRWHTTGRAGMSPLEKTLFAADYLEPGRGLENKLLVELLPADFNTVFLEIVSRKITWVLEKGERLHPKSVECYNSLLSNRSVK